MENFMALYGNSKTLLELIQTYGKNVSVSTKHQTMFDIGYKSLYSEITEKQANYFKILLLGRLLNEEHKDFVRSLPLGQVKKSPYFKNCVYYLGKGVWLCRLNYDLSTVNALRIANSYYSKDGYNVFRENLTLLDHIRTSHNKVVEFTEAAEERWNLIYYLSLERGFFIEMSKVEQNYKVIIYSTDPGYLQHGGYLQEWLFDEKEILSYLYSVSVTMGKQRDLYNITIDNEVKSDLFNLLEKDLELNKKLLTFYDNRQPTSMKHIRSEIYKLFDPK